MDNAGRFITVTFAVLALFSGCRHCQQVTQGPSNSTVLSGSQARFNCTVTGAWATITWFHGDTQVLIIARNLGIVNIDNRFSAFNYTASGSFTSELILLDARVSDTGWIRCNLFSSHYFAAFLSVQVNGTVQITNHSLTVVANERAPIVCQASGWLPAPQMTWKTTTSSVDPANYSTFQSDGPGVLRSAVSTLILTFAENETVTCLASIETLPVPQSATVSLTVVEKPVKASNSLERSTVIIIAVVVTIGGILLIIIIVIIVICCCRRRKKEESTYQNQIKKVSVQRKNNLSIVSKNVAGSANLGYTEDLPASRRPLPKIPSESSKSLDSFEAAQQYGGNPAFEVRTAYNIPDYPANSLSSSSRPQVRQLTHV